MRKATQLVVTLDTLTSPADAKEIRTAVSRLRGVVDVRPSAPAAPARPLPEPTGPLHLSPRQVEVCCLVAAGETDQGIAGELHITAKTVRTHIVVAAGRIKEAMPSLTGSPRRIILGYYVEYAGVAAYERRRAGNSETGVAA